MTLHLRLLSPSGELLGEVMLSAFPVELGSDPTCAVVADRERFPVVSGRHARIDQTPAGLVLTHLSQKNKTFLNDTAVEVPAILNSGDRVRLGGKSLGATLEVAGIDGDSAQELPAAVKAPGPATAREWGSTLAANAADLSALRRFVHTTLAVEVGEGGVLGRDPASRFHLPHPLVSRRHAALTVQAGQTILSDLGSANGTFVNGEPLTRPATLTAGDAIDIGPYSLTFDGRELRGATRSGNAELVALGVTRSVRDRATGKPLTLLCGVSLMVRPREFICLLGPSGSGKSTLLTMLSGRASPDAGAVLLNGQDLYAHFETLKRDVAVVPQRDVLHESLAVGAALQYTAELRLPPDTDPVEVYKAVSDTLGVVGLTSRRETLIRHLSGGQVKRASLANELLCQPTLLFLDEVTSGLDEQTDRDLMELFRQIADGGKTVVCITHNLANVEATCHIVVILTAGGRLAFVGPPEAAKEYFGVARLGEVYRVLARHPAEEWEERFQGSPYHAEYVAARLPASTTPAPAPTVRPAVRDRSLPIRQAAILVRRYVAVWRGDSLALLAMLGQSLLVAFLLGLVFADLPGVAVPAERVHRTANLLFLLNVSCFWLGCNNAAKELVRERAIYRRERAINLRADSYYASKYLVLLGIGLVQAALLFGVVRIWCEPAGSAVIQWLTLSVLMAAGTAMGLLISAASPTEEVATALVPVAVIPQIVMAGVIAPLSGAGKWLGYGLITCFWGRRALEGLLPEDDVGWLGREAVTPWPQIGVVAAHAGVFIVATILILVYQQRLLKWGSRLHR